MATWQQVIEQTVTGLGYDLVELERSAGGLARAEDGQSWQISWRDEPAVKPGQKVSKKREAAPLNVLGFTLDELREARLAPIVDFKGRKPR